MRGAGARVGPYTLEAPLGAGGMGAVWRARHVELGAVRALKLMLRADDPQARARFEREATALGAVRHPGVVGVHEVGVEPDGTPWLAMDLVEGEPLERVVARGPLPAARAVAVALDVARGVGALHAAGFVHRDLKPANVVLTPDGRAVVLDLGLALAPGRDARLTATGAFVGSVAYVAPEQLEGAPTPATDVHAVGLLLHELLTGEAAIDATGSTVQVVARVMAEVRPRPGALRPDLPAALDDLVVRAMARDPAARPRDGLALAAALEAVAAAPGPTVRALRRRRAVVAAVAVAVAAAVVVVAAAVAARRPAAPPPAAGAAPPPPSTAAGPPGDAPEGPAAPAAGGPAAADDPAAVAALRDARRLEDPAARRDALLAWLDAHPRHPRRPSAEAALAEALRRVPRRAGAIAETAGALVAVGADAVGVTLQRGRVALVDRRTWATRATWSVGAEARGLALAPDGRALVVSGTGPDRVTRIPLEEGAAPAALGDLPGRPTAALAVAPDGAVLVGLDRDVVLLEPGAPPRALEPPRAPVSSVAFAGAGGELLVAGTGAGSDLDLGEARNALFAWDRRTGRLAGVLDAFARVATIAALPGLPPRALVGRASGHLSFAALAERPPTFDDDLRDPALARPGTPLPLENDRAHGTVVRGLRVTRDGRRAVSLASDRRRPPGELSVWDLPGRRLVGRAVVSADALALDLASDEATALVLEVTGRVGEWDLAAIAAATR